MYEFMSYDNQRYIAIFGIGLLFVIGSCKPPVEPLDVKVYQTSASGDALKETPVNNVGQGGDTLRIFSNKKLQTISGFGGAFTESGAYLLNKLSEVNRKKVIEAYFSNDGARYSLCRTHINSCDFSLGHYSYAPVPGDTLLDSFSISEDVDDLIPFILDAQLASSEGFQLVASPWTAPPWMKDNQKWEGGKLLSEHYDTWADFFVRYHKAYAAEGINLWGYTVENEPLGNGLNWESMHFEPKEMSVFVKDHLGPAFRDADIKSKILVYDQNRDKDLELWARELLTDESLSPFIYGTAVHWYSNTVDWMGPSLQLTHELAPKKHILHTEGCIDAEVPHWQEDEWYWKKEATDWGWDWASEDKKKDHPKYVPVYRYAGDMIGCLNNWVEGWIDWNMLLDRQGGPNHASNWCVAPVIVDPDADDVYFTPLYYVMSHFSRFIRPGAQVLTTSGQSEGLLMAAVENPDGSTVLTLLNKAEGAKSFVIALDDESVNMSIQGKALQTIVLKTKYKL